MGTSFIAGKSVQAQACPWDYETDALLRNGSAIRLRPLRREDAEAWVTFVSQLSPHAKYRRCFDLPKKGLGLEEGLRFCAFEYRDIFPFVAEVTTESGARIVGIGSYYRLPGRQVAEVALVVADAYQGKGIGTKLLDCLVEAARDNGITSFAADVLPENYEMMAVLQHSEFDVRSETIEGVNRVAFPIAELPQDRAKPGGEQPIAKGGQGACTSGC